MTYFRVKPFNILQFVNEKGFVSAESGAAVLIFRQLVDGVKVFQRIISLEAHSVHICPYASTVFIVVESAVDALLLDGHKMQLWTKKTSMLCVAILTVTYLELIDDVF